MTITALHRESVSGQPSNAGAAHDLPRLEDLRVNGSKPFWSNADAAQERISEAHALLTVISQAFKVCEEAGPEKADAFSNLRPEIKGVALDGVCTLLALAMHNTDVEDALARQAKARRA